MVKSQAGLKKPQGKSLFNNTSNMSKVLSDTQVHQISANAVLPEGLGVIADGRDVGGTMSEGHHTVFPTKDMSFDEFSSKINSIESEHIGKIDKNKNFIPKPCP